MKQNNYKFTKAALLISMLSISFSASAEKSSFQSAGMKEFPMMTSVLPGAGTLVRTQHTAYATLSMSGLDTNAAYTVWWTVYNKPENCANGPGTCSVFDINNPATGASVFYASGFVTGNDGFANVTARLKAGDLPKGYDVMIPGGLKRGNGFKAEIVLAG